MIIVQVWSRCPKLPQLCSTIPFCARYPMGGIGTLVDRAPNNKEHIVKKFIKIPYLHVFSKEMQTVALKKASH
jgi:hypothetical protein